MKNIFINDQTMADNLRNFVCKSPTLIQKILGQKPKSDFNIFDGRDWWILAEEKEFQPEYNGEKFDLMFFDAESLEKYHDHRTYQMDLRKIKEKYGTSQTKIVVFEHCSKCNEFVEEFYKNMSIDFSREKTKMCFEPVMLIEKYFQQ